MLAKCKHSLDGQETFVRPMALPGVLYATGKTLNLSQKGINAISKIQLVVYYQCCVVIGWATTRLYVIAH